MSLHKNNRKYCKNLDGARWSSFQVLPLAASLGFMLGPSAGQRTFEAPLHKLTERTFEIAATGTSSLHNTIAYNTDAATILSYVMQLAVLPGGHARGQLGRASSILKIPYKAFGSSLPFRLLPFHPSIVFWKL